MGKYIISLLSVLLLLACNTVKSVQSDFDCELIPYPIKNFEVDVFGNLYTIDLRNELKVYDNQSNLLFKYYNNGLGDIEFIDISNPRKIILFFPGFQKMIFLDNTLSEIARVDYEGSIIPYDIRAIGSSRDNNIWIYDAIDYKLKKINPTGKLIIESNPMESYLQINLMPDYIIEHNNEVFLFEKNVGFVVFDNYGTYLRANLIENIECLQFVNENLIYKVGSVLYSKPINNNFVEQKSLLSLPVESGKSYLRNRKVFFLENMCLRQINFSN